MIDDGGAEMPPWIAAEERGTDQEQGRETAYHPRVNARGTARVPVGLFSSLRRIGERWPRRECHREGTR